MSNIITAVSQLSVLNYKLLSFCGSDNNICERLVVQNEFNLKMTCTVVL